MGINVLLDDDVASDDHIRHASAIRVASRTAAFSFDYFTCMWRLWQPSSSALCLSITHSEWGHIVGGVKTPLSSLWIRSTHSQGIFLGLFLPMVFTRVHKSTSVLAGASLRQAARSEPTQGYNSSLSSPSHGGTLLFFFFSVSFC